MAQKVFMLDGIGEVTVAKRRGARNIRISIGANGRIRIGVPAWTPYRVGLEFARSHRQWIAEKLQERPRAFFRDGQSIGKAHRLEFVPAVGDKPVTTKILGSSIQIRTDSDVNTPSVQAAAKQASEKALKIEAETLLPQRLSALAQQNGFEYKDVRIRKLTSRWGSCSSQKVITLSYLLIQLPWELIDYVLIHELAHTRQMNHGPKFWEEVSSILPNAKQLRKDIKEQHPNLAVA